MRVTAKKGQHIRGPHERKYVTLGKCYATPVITSVGCCPLGGRRHQCKTVKLDSFTVNLNSEKVMFELCAMTIFIVDLSIYIL